MDRYRHRGRLALCQPSVAHGFRAFGAAAVARIRELSNALENLDPGDPGAAGAVLREGLETVTRLLGPMMPHLAEEMWQHLGHGEMLADVPWPIADAQLA